MARLERNTYSEEIIFFLLKLVVAFGSIYLIFDKFIQQIKHLFNIYSIEVSLNIVYAIYFLLIPAVVFLYFLVKRQNYYLSKRKKISVKVIMLPASIIVITLFIFILFNSNSTTFFWVGNAIILVLFIIFILSFFINQKRTLKWDKFELLPICIALAVLTALLLYTNNDRIKSLEGNLENKKALIFKLYNLNDSINNLKNIPESNFYKINYKTLETVDEVFLRKALKGLRNDSLFSTSLPLNEIESILGKESFSKADSKKISIFAKTLRSNIYFHYGLYQNLKFFKALIVQLIFINIILYVVFLIRVFKMEESNEDLIKLIKTKEDYEVHEPIKKSIKEKEFLKTIVIILSTLTVPLFHPIEEVNVNPDNPFIGSFFKNRTVETINYEQDPPIDTARTSNVKNETINVSIVDLDSGYQAVVISNKEVNLNNIRMIKINDLPDFSKLESGLTTINENLIYFSESIGDAEPDKDKDFRSKFETIDDHDNYHKAAFVYKRKNNLKPIIFNKD